MYIHRRTHIFCQISPLFQPHFPSTPNANTFKSIKNDLNECAFVCLSPLSMMFVRPRKSIHTSVYEPFLHCHYTHNKFITLNLNEALHVVTGWRCCHVVYGVEDADVVTSSQAFLCKLQKILKYA